MRSVILIVEDSEDDAHLLTGLLRRCGVENPICVVRDGSEAMEYLEGWGKFSDRTQYPLPGVLFLDLKLPRVDGFEVLSWLRLRPEFKSVLTIVLSALNGVAEINRAYWLGAQTFLAKPCVAQDVQNLTQSFPGYWVTGSVSGITPTLSRETCGTET